MQNFLPKNYPHTYNRAVSDLSPDAAPCVHEPVYPGVRAPVHPCARASASTGWGQLGGTAAAVRLVDIALVQHSGDEHLARHLPARLWGNRNSAPSVRKYGRTQP